MFEYATEVAMSLKYNEERKQIIYSHLAPNSIDPTLEGQFQYYGPDGSFDALTLKKGKWYQETDIDIRKLKDKNEKALTIKMSGLFYYICVDVKATT